MEKFIFLDFDGVLHTIGYESYLDFLGKPEFDEYGAIFSPDAIDNLRRVIGKTRAKIVVSSIWREEGLSWLQRMWTVRNLPGEIVGMTPSIDRRKYREKNNTHLGVRGTEIQQWLDEHAGGCYRYVAIDDEDDYLYNQSNNVILTNPQSGLTNEIADMAIKLLN